MFKNSILLISIIFVLGLSGCGGGGTSIPDSGTRKGTMRLAVIWPPKTRDTILEHSESLQIEVTASDGDGESVLINRPAQNEAQTETIVKRLPEGDATVTVTAWQERDAQGRELGHGTQEFPILAGQTVEVTVQLESSTGGARILINNNEISQIDTQPAFRVDPRQERYARGTVITLVGRISERGTNSPIVSEPLEFWMKSDKHPQGRRISTVSANTEGRALYAWAVPTDPNEDNISLWVIFRGTWLFTAAETLPERLPIG